MSHCPIDSTISSFDGIENPIFSVTALMGL